MESKVAVFNAKDKNFSIVSEKLRDELQPNEVLMRNMVVPVNEIDVVDGYMKGLSHLGHAAYGEVQKCGEAVTWIKPGDRMIYLTSIDSFREYKIVDHEKLIKAPENLSPKAAVSLIYRGCLAHMITVRAFILKEGMYVLVDNIHTATGSAIGWMARSRGGFVIGLSTEKGNIPNSVCDMLIDPSQSDAFQKIFNATKGAGCNVYFSGITPIPFAQMSSFMTLSGVVVDQISVFRNVTTDSLAEKSLFVTSPIMEHYKVLKSELVLTVDEVIAMNSGGSLQMNYSDYSLTGINEAFQEVSNGKSRNAVVVNI